MFLRGVGFTRFGISKESIYIFKETIFILFGEVLDVHNTINYCPVKFKNTYYVRDASGNPMAIYEKGYKDEGAGNYKEQLKMNDFQMYGSSRLGSYTPDEGDKLIAERDFTASVQSGIFTNDSQTGFTTEIVVADRSEHWLGLKAYEGSNHLGNVLVVFKDTKIALNTDNDNTVDGFKAMVVNASDYYPGGSIMPGRSYTSQNGSAIIYLVLFKNV